MGPLAPLGLPAVTFTHSNQGLEKAIMTAMAERGRGNWKVIGFEGTYKTSPSFAL